MDSDASSVASSAPSAASVQPADKSAADTNADKSAAPDASEEVKPETCPPETKETIEGYFFLINSREVYNIGAESFYWIRVVKDPSKPLFFPLVR